MLLDSHAHSCVAKEPSQPQPTSSELQAHRLDLPALALGDCSAHVSLQARLTSCTLVGHTCSVYMLPKPHMREMLLYCSTALERAALHAVGATEGAGCAQQPGPVRLPAARHRPPAAHGQVADLWRNGPRLPAHRGPPVVEACMRFSTTVLMGEHGQINRPMDNSISALQTCFKSVNTPGTWMSTNSIDLKHDLHRPSRTILS